MPKTDKRDADLPLQPTVGAAEGSSSLQKFVFPPEQPKDQEEWLQFRRVHRSHVLSTLSAEAVQVAVPSHRLTPLKKNWMELYKPITQVLQLDMRMNLKTRKV